MNTIINEKHPQLVISKYNNVKKELGFYLKDDRRYRNKMVHALFHKINVEEIIIFLHNKVKEYFYVWNEWKFYVILSVTCEIRNL